MTIETLIDCINSDIITARQINNSNVKGHLILQKTITENIPFKAYKEYIYILWLVKDKPIKVIDIVYTSNSSLESKEDVDKIMFKLFMSALLPLIQSITYKKIIEGTYNEYTSK